MEQAAGIGYLASFATGEPHLLPVEFVAIGGQLWGATSVQARKYAGFTDGQRVEVLLVSDDTGHDRVRGMLQCSTDAEDRRLLWTLQASSLAHWYQGADDPNLIVLKVIPEGSELPQEARQERRAA